MPTFGRVRADRVDRVSLARLARSSVGMVVVAAVVVLLVRIVAAGLLVFYFSPEQDRFTRAAAAASLAHAGMLDQETGIRAFLAARDQSFLATYSTGQRELAEGNLELASIVGGDSQIAADVRATEAAQRRWSDGWALPALSSADVATGAILPEFLVRGKLLFDDYRQIQARLETDIENQQAGSRQFENTTLMGFSVLEIAVLLAALVYAGRRVRRLRVEVADPVARISTAVGELVAGRYEARVRSAGRVEEFAPISHGIDQLAEVLGALSIQADIRDQEREEQAARMRLLLELTRDIAGSLSLRYILRSVGESSLKVTPFTTAVVWLVDEEAKRLLPAYSSGGPDGQPLGLEPIELGSSLPGLAAKYGQAFQHSIPSDPPAGYRPETTVGGIAVPMIVGARCIGVIELASEDAGSGTGVDIPVIETLAIHAGSAIEAARLHRASEEQAQVDALTRLFNRRRLDDDLGQEIARAIRYQRPLAFVMLDTDHFKQLNDDLGHQKGDEVLQELSAVLKEALRSSDTAYRYGGEEFALLLRETSGSEAAAAAERLRARIEQRFSGRGNVAHVTASFGVAAVGPGVDSAEELVRTADNALYAAKQAGRNRVIVAPANEARPAIRPVG